MTLINESTTKAHDISNVEGTYSKCLDDHYDEITQKFEDPNVSTQDFKNFIISVVNPASNTKAKQKFLLTLQKQTSKYKIEEFITNALLRGSGLSSRLDDRFEKDK